MVRSQFSGPECTQQAYLDDAQAVAREIMRRARHNVEALIVKLEPLGYELLTANRNAATSLQGLSQAMGMMKAMGQFTAGNHSNPHGRATKRG